MMIDAHPTPEFPNRPDHPDFRLLAEVSQGHDNRAETESVEVILGELVDEPSLMYLIKHRLGMYGVPIEQIGPQMWTIMSAIYFDAFATGVDFQKRGGHHPNETGTAGEGGSL